LDLAFFIDRQHHRMRGRIEAILAKLDCCLVLSV